MPKTKTKPVANFENLSETGWLESINVKDYMSDFSKPSSVILCDTSVFAYLTLQKLINSNVWGFKPKQLTEQQVKDQIPTIRAILAGFVGGHFWREKLPVIFLKDAPYRNYWRTKKLAKCNVAYKANRETQRGLTDTVVSEIKCILFNLIKDHKLAELQIDEFEADDLAAAFCIRYPNQQFELFTVDSDWIGLVNERVSWNNFVRHQVTRVTLSNHRHLQKDWTRWENYETPQDIWNYKAIYGDVSDNLPPNTPIGFINLLNPLVSPFQIEPCDTFDQVLEQATYSATSNPASFLSKKGLSILGFDTKSLNLTI